MTNNPYKPPGATVEDRSADTGPIPNDARVPRRAQAISRLALVIAATVCVLVGFLLHSLMTPHWNPQDGHWYRLIDPIPDDVAMRLRIEARVVLLMAVLISAAQSLAAWRLRTSRLARAGAGAFGIVYAVLAACSIIAWLGERHAPALLIVALVLGALSVAILMGALPPPGERHAA
jgi:hypothetical protein